MVGKIIITGNSIEEIEEQLATIKGLAAAGCKCGCGGSSVTECEKALDMVKRMKPELVLEALSTSLEIEIEEEIDLSEYAVVDLLGHISGICPLADLEGVPVEDICEYLESVI